MADVPLDQLYILAARRLKIIQINEPLSAEDRQSFADIYPLLYSMLEDRGVAVWSPDADVPERHALPVRDLLAEQVAGEFGKDFVAGPWAMNELYRQASPVYRGAVTRFEDY